MVNDFRCGYAVNLLSVAGDVLAPVGVDPVAEIPLIPCADFVEQASTKKHASAADLLNFEWCGRMQIRSRQVFSGKWIIGKESGQSRLSAEQAAKRLRKISGRLLNRSIGIEGSRRHHR